MGKESQIRSKEEVDKALQVVEQLRKTEVMGQDVYHKCLVSIAYEYVMADLLEEGLMQLSRVPADYYRDVQPRHMEDDSMYRDLVVILAYRLIQAGVVENSDPVSTPTMPMARA